jgi:hypothetical protein
MNAHEATAVATVTPEFADTQFAAPIGVAQATKVMTVPPPKQPAMRISKKWIALYATFVLTSVVLLVIFVLNRRFAQSVVREPGASGSAVVEPDDPSWRPSSAKRSPATPARVRSAAAGAMVTKTIEVPAALRR